VIDLGEAYPLDGRANTARRSPAVTIAANTTKFNVVKDR
jgi:hypothetical protein